MSLAPVRNYGTGQGLCPIFQPHDCLIRGLSLPAFSTFVQGQVMGFVPNTNSNVAVNDVQTITISGSPGSGTFTTVIGGVPGTYQYNITPANLAIALTQQWNIGVYSVPGLPTLGPSNVTVTGTAGASYVITFVNQLGGILIPTMTVSSAFNTGSIAVVHTTPGQPANGYYNTYTAGNTDGSQIATAFLQYQTATTGTGQCVLGSQYADGNDATGGMFWQSPGWFSGWFQASSLFTLDSSCVGSSINSYKINVVQGNPTNLSGAAASTTLVALTGG